MSEAPAHRPVLLEEVLTALQLRPDGIYVDGTFGRGGHAEMMLQRLGPEGRLLAMDKDPEAVAVARKKFAGDDRFEIEQGSFALLGHWVRAREWAGRVDGVLLDLGVSSPQLDDAERGFSFRRDGDLDMRMDPTSGMSAAQWLAIAAERDIVQVLRDYGEERFAKRIARAIVEARAEKPITRTRQLAQLIAAAQPSREPGKDPATRSFQAIRIFINHELDDLRDCLPQVLEALRPGGRMAVISFHSLEDRIVKRFIRAEAQGRDVPHDLPVTEAQIRRRLLPVGKAISASNSEIELNPRARSAVLRVAEKLQ